MWRCDVISVLDGKYLSWNCKRCQVPQEVFMLLAFSWRSNSSFEFEFQFP